MTVFAIVDPGNLIREDAEDNNVASQSVRVALHEELRVTSLHHGPAGLTVVWVSSPGDRYRIWQSDDLAEWSELPTVIESSGRATSWMDDAVSEVGQRFYKIELLP